MYPREATALSGIISFSAVRMMPVYLPMSENRSPVTSAEQIIFLMAKTEWPALEVTLQQVLKLNY